MHGCKARNVGERQTSVDGGRQDAAAPKRTFVRRRHEVVQSSSGTLRRAVSYMFSSSSARWRLVFTAVSFLGNVRPPFWEIRSLPPPLPPPCSLARQSSLLVRQRSLARSPPFSMCALAAPLCLPLCLALCRCRVRCLPACLSSRGTPAVRARRVLFFFFPPTPPAAAGRAFRSYMTLTRTQRSRRLQWTFAQPLDGIRYLEIGARPRTRETRPRTRAHGHSPFISRQRPSANTHAYARIH